MLNERSVAYTYREYTKQPLSADEIREVLDLLGMKPAQVLRKHDAANKALGLTGDEPDGVLIARMAEHPTLLQRPIGIRDGRAELGRPVENLLKLL